MVVVWLNKAVIETKSHEYFSGIISVRTGIPHNKVFRINLNGEKLGNRAGAQCPVYTTDFTRQAHGGAKADASVLNTPKEFDNSKNAEKSCITANGE